ncbi:hypothetical protein VIGAN_04259200, partial [Vigna angularis var. angularis]
MKGRKYHNTIITPILTNEMSFLFHPCCIKEPLQREMCFVPFNLHFVHSPTLNSILMSCLEVGEVQSFIYFH